MFKVVLLYSVNTKRFKEVELGSNNNWFVLSFSRVLTVKYISAVHRPLPFSQKWQNGCGLRPIL